MSAKIRYGDLRISCSDTMNVVIVRDVWQQVDNPQTDTEREFGKLVCCQWLSTDENGECHWIPCREGSTYGEVIGSFGKAQWFDSFVERVG